MNLYTRLVDIEARRHRLALDKLASQLPAILNAERMAAALLDAGLPAKVEERNGGLGDIRAEWPIDRLSELGDMLATVASTTGRRIVANGHDEYMILPPDETTDMPGVSFVVVPI